MNDHTLARFYVVLACGGVVLATAAAAAGDRVAAALWITTAAIALITGLAAGRK